MHRMRHELNLGNAKFVSLFLAPGIENTLKTYTKNQIFLAFASAL